MRLSMLVWVCVLACVACASAGAAEVDFAQDRHEIVKGLTAPAQPKGLDIGPAGGKREVEVIRQKALGSPSSRGFEAVERDSSPKVNLKIEFDFDSAQLRQESRPLLRDLASALQDERLSGSRFAVNGHADSVGPAEYNLVLSFRRARAVMDYLVQEGGVSGDRLEVAGFGEAVPLVPNDSKRNRQLNRRVEIERLE